MILSTLGLIIGIFIVLVWAFLTRTKKDSSSSFSIGETFNLDNNVEMIIHSAKFIQDPENSYEESPKILKVVAEIKNNANYEVMTNVENFELYSNIQEFEKYRLYSTHAIQSDYEVIVPPGDNAKQTIYFEVKRFHKFELYYKYIDKEFKINIGVENYKSLL